MLARVKFACVCFDPNSSLRLEIIDDPRYSGFNISSYSFKADFRHGSTAGVIGCASGILRCLGRVSKP